jgi:glycosyltransferase involved in cell wall biosynthesis
MSASTPRVVHLTSAHPRFDARIFLKQCRSLAEAGYDIHLLVADGRGDCRRDGVTILDVGRPRRRIERMSVTVGRMLRRAQELNPQVCHLHDPELLTIVSALARSGTSVVFDAHEDVPLQILTKPYLWRSARTAISWSYRRFESRVCSRLDAVVTATPHIRDKFRSINDLVVDINNYPIVGELSLAPPDWANKRRQVCYVGGISVDRGIREMVHCLEHLESDAELVLCGRFEDERVLSELQAHAGWGRVRFLGWQDREGVARVLAESMAGLVTLQPSPRYLDAHPVKMFEYMSASLPVISSNFPLWRRIVETNDCGVCVEPTSAREIAAAIDSLVLDPDRARELGANGAAAIQAKYNWRLEEHKLLKMYRQVVSTVSSRH